jgi:hypothetical protein
MRSDLCLFQHRAGIFKQSMGTRNRVGIGLLYWPARLHWLAELVPWNRFLCSSWRTKTKSKTIFFQSEEKRLFSYLNYRRNEGKRIYSFLNYQRNEDNPKYLFLNHRRNEEKVMHLSLIYQRDVEKRIYMSLNYRRNEDKPKYLFLNYRRKEDKAKYSFLNYRWFDIATRVRLPLKANNKSIIV